MFYNSLDKMDTRIDGLASKTDALEADVTEINRDLQEMSDQESSRGGILGIINRTISSVLNMIKSIFSKIIGLVSCIFFPIQRFDSIQIHV